MEVEISSSNQQFDLAVDFDSQLNEIPRNPTDMHTFVNQLISQIEDLISIPEATWNNTKISDQLGVAGTYLKNLGRLQEAHDYLLFSLNLIEKHDLGVRPFVVQSLRYSDVKRRMNDFSESENILNGIVKICRLHPEMKNYLDLALHHFGQLRFSQSRYEDALVFFAEALELRKNKGQAKLIESTELAIAATKNKL